MKGFLGEMIEKWRGGGSDDKASWFYRLSLQGCLGYGSIYRHLLDDIVLIKFSASM